MDSNSVDKVIPSPSHGDVGDARMDDVVTGLSCVVISQADKQKYTLDLLKNITEDDMVTTKDLGLNIEAEDMSLPDLDASLTVKLSMSLEGELFEGDK